MRITHLLLPLVIGAASFACSDGDAGEAGEQGPEGPDGPDGPDGPIASAPHLDSLSPEWGSALTTVTIRGENFSPTAEDNDVTFNGIAAEVISASATELEVMPSLAVDAATPAVVHVEVDNLISNGLVFQLVASGAALPQAPLPFLFTSTVRVGGTTYVALGGGIHPSSGLYTIDDDGWMRKVMSAPEIPFETGGDIRFDGPVMLAKDGGELYFVNSLGSVYRYDAESGNTIEVLSNLGPGDPDAQAATSLVVDGDNIAILMPMYGGLLLANEDGFFDFLGLDTDSVRSMTGDSDDMYFTNISDQTIDRVEDPFGAQTFTPGFVTFPGDDDPTAVTILGDDLVVATDSAVFTAPAATGGLAALASEVDGEMVHLSPSGTDLFITLGGTSGEVLLSEDLEEPSLVAAGAGEVTLGSVAIGSSLYLNTLGDGTGHIVQMRASGRTRPVARGTFFDIADATDGMVIASDIDAGEIIEIDLATGDRSVLLDGDDGIGVPTGVHMTSGGTLFYYDFDTPTIGRLTSAGTHTPAFADPTEAPGTHFFFSGLTGTDDHLFLHPFGPAPDEGWLASVSTATGAVNIVLGVGKAGSIFGVGTSGDRAFISRAGGQILEFDADSGDLWPLGIAPTEFGQGRIHGAEGGFLTITDFFSSGNIWQMAQ